MAAVSVETVGAEMNMEWLFVIVDEVGALVFDIGHYSLRAGYAGEDSPKAEIPSMVGVVSEGFDNGPMEIDGQTTTSQKKYFIDTTCVNVPRKNMEMTTYLKDGMSEFVPIFEVHLILKPIKL